jgi:hypothetical protein
MSYSQEIYDAVRSKISGGNIGDVVQEVARNAFDISWAVDAVKQEYLSAAYEQQRPSVLFRPKIMVDGTAWCALLGADLQSGVAGFGDTPAAAMSAFDQAFWKGRTPAAAQALASTEATASGEAK